MNIVEPIRDIEKIDEIEKVLKRMSIRNYLLFAIGIHTGLRISDILPLKVQDVRNKTYISITEKKTKKAKKIRIQPDLEAVFKKYIKDLPNNDYIFKSRKGKNKPISREQAYRILKNAACQCNVFEIGTHTLRKTFGYHTYKRDKDLALVQKMLNHSKSEHTLRYIGILQDDEDTARLKLKYKKEK